MKPREWWFYEAFKEVAREVFRKRRGAINKFLKRIFGR
jgi:hypothetical protein